MFQVKFIPGQRIRPRKCPVIPVGGFGRPKKIEVPGIFSASDFEAE